MNSTLAAAIHASLAGLASQHRRILAVHGPAGPDVLLAESLRGSEGISEGFRFELAALSLDAAIPLKSLIGQPLLVELATGAGPVRAFHGHATDAELLGSNGGLARYRLTLEPWTAFLALGRDSRIFQDMTVCDILEAVFGAWDGKGRLAPAWRFELRDRAAYPARSITTQYQESDLVFAERLMLEEGLFYFFEHEADAASPSFGRHVLVIADHNDAFQPNRQPLVRFTQPGAVMREDSIDRWRTEWRLQPDAVELSSWDYRSRSLRSVASSAGGTLVIRDHPGAYAYPTRKHGLQLADRQLEALQARREVHVGAGTVRTFAPGTTFTLQGHAGADGRFAIVRTLHLAHNNLDADTGKALARLLGRCPLRAAIDSDLGASLHATGRGPGERPVYRNRIDAIPADVPYRATARDGAGALLRPRPSVVGQQTAIVVGPPGAVVHTDRDHRIKVQFHWQRGSASHNRLSHPAPDGHADAAADDRSGTWLRVATPLAPVAGANWGSHALPRVGQEVLVDFLDGDIDRPVVIGTVYNGAGAPDAQHNAVAHGAGAATGNAPAWFPGETGGHAHPAALSGIKSQALQSSQGGAGGFGQLVFDDSPGEARIGLQRHGAAYAGTDELNLGHLRHQSDNRRLDTAGFGAELRTEHGAALRAGRGLLLSADPATPGAAQLDSNAARQQVEDAAGLVEEMATLAQKHLARLEGEPDSPELPAARGLRRTIESLAAREGAEGEQVTAFGQPQVQLSAPGGIAALTPLDAIVSAAESSVLGAGQDVNFASQANWFHSARHGIGLFTYGKASNANKPNQETGIRLHAASGKVSMQSQSGATRIMADKAITVASVTQAVNVAARTHVALTAQGASLRLECGNIELVGPGTIAFKASMKELAGPAAASAELPALPHPANIANAIELNFQYDDLDAVPGASYKVTFADGSVRSGKLDERGHAEESNVPPGEYTVEFGEDPRDWEAPLEEEPEYKKASVREEARLAIEQARAENERNRG